MNLSFATAPLSEQIATHLTEQIVFGNLPPGEKINETYWANTLNVSTNSLREAIKVLESKHLIEVKPRRGAWVCSVSQSQAKQLYDFLFMLFAELAARAANNWQEEDRKSTRLNSSHVSISYAVFCLKTKRRKRKNIQST